MFMLKETFSVIQVYIKEINNKIEYVNDLT